MFWCVSRSKIKGWIDVLFSAASNGGVEFGRGNPTYKAASYTPAVDNMEDPSIVCGGAADSSFACMEPTSNYTILWQNNLTAGVIAANPLFSTEGDRIYYVADDGIFYSVNPMDGMEFWNAPTGVTIQANFAMTSDGAYLFFGDSSGNILAWQIAESDLGGVTVTPPQEDTASPSGSSAPGAESSVPMPPTTVGAPTTAPAPTPTSTSGAASMAVFSVIVASVVTAAAFF
jgi:hypothetical protein